MKNYEKKSLIKFTLIYFLSTAIFILILGYLYHGQQKTFILQKHAMKMHEYIITLKQTNFKHAEEFYTFKRIKKDIVKYQLPIKENGFYTKVFPSTKENYNILVKINAEIIDNEIKKAKQFVLFWQIISHIVFLIISFILAKISLRPMNETITSLDRFIKDLIHDLNTPSTAILLNSKMLSREITNEKSQKKIYRIEQSAKSIASLYENLEIFLDKDIKKNKLDLYPILKLKKENFKLIFPEVKIYIDKKNMLVDSNEKAISRIIENILSNACKYSNENPKIHISFNNNILSIKDNGKGIKFPKKIFERAYTENELGHGIGMHIVHRLVLELEMDINIVSQEEKGTIIELIF